MVFSLIATTNTSRLIAFFCSLILLHILLAQRYIIFSRYTLATFTTSHHVPFPTNVPPLAITNTTAHSAKAQPTGAISSYIQTPAPISHLIPLHRSPHDIASIRSIPFTKPHVLTTYIRPSLTFPPPAIDVYILTFGLALRKLNISHCIVDGILYPVDSYIDEVTLCVLPLAPMPNVSISVVLGRTPALRTALEEDKELSAGHQAARLRPNADVEVRNLPDSETQIHILLPKLHFDPTRVDQFDPSHAQFTPRYAVCMATMASTAPHAIPDWVDYHRTLGVDHVFIFNNGLPTTIIPIFARRPDVTIIPWPWQKSQTHAFTFMLLAARRRCVRVFKPDIDEYLLLGLGSNPFSGRRRPLHEFLRHEQQRSGGLRHVKVDMLFMANSGYVRRPKGRIPELYVHMRRDQPHKNGKSICHVDEDWRAARVHPCGKNRAGKMPAQAHQSISEMGGKYWPRTPGKPAVLVHFFAQSWDDWVEKWSAGVAGVLAGINGDSMKDRVANTSEPDAEYVNAESTLLVRYTFFRSVFRQVMELGAGRLKEFVLERVEDEDIRTKVVHIGDVSMFE